MMRLIASIILEVLANAIGLLAAAWILGPDFSITITGFVLVVAIFTAVRFVLAPLMLQLSMRYVRALVGGISLVTILLSFVITSFLTSHLVIRGVSTWILATLIVWAFGLAASILLPFVIFKKTLATASNNRSRPPTA